MNNYLFKLIAEVLRQLESLQTFFTKFKRLKILIRELITSEIIPKKW